MRKFLILFLLATVPVFGQVNVQTISVSGSISLQTKNNLTTLFNITLTGNVTLASIDTGFKGQQANFNICQNSVGGFTWTWPGTFQGTSSISIATGASACTQAQFINVDGTTWQSVGGSGGGISSPASPGSLTGLIDAGLATYGGVSQSRGFFTDGSTTSGQNTLTSANLNCTTADNGKLVLVTNTGPYPFGTGLITQTGCNSATVATLSGNASSTSSGLTWSIGADAFPAFNAAATAAWTNNAGLGLYLPCGAYILSDRAFVFTVAQNFIQMYMLQGCAGNNGTTLILHPNITHAITSSGGNIVYGVNTALQAGTFTGNGINGHTQVAHLRVTTLGGALPGTGAFNFFSGMGKAVDIQLNSFGMAGGSCIALNMQAGEDYVEKANIQNSTVAQGFPGSCTGASVGGQGVQVVRDSIIAFLQNAAVSVGGPTDLDSDYITANGGTGNGSVNLVASADLLNVFGGVITCSATPANSCITTSNSNHIIRLFGTQVNSNNGGQTAALIVVGSTDTLVNNNSVINSGVVGLGVTGTGKYYDQGTSLISGGFNNSIGSALQLIADGHSSKGACTGVATASSTLGLYGTGPNETLTTCTSTTIGSGTVVSGSRTLQNLVVTASAGGVNASSGVVTVLRNGGATTITCTLGTGTSCIDGTHTVAISDGDLISLQFTTQAADTLAGVKAVVEWN